MSKTLLTCTGPAWWRFGLALSLQPVSDCACFMSSAKASLSFTAALKLAPPPLLGRLLGSFFDGTFGRKLCAWPSLHASHRQEKGLSVRSEFSASYPRTSCAVVAASAGCSSQVHMF